MAGSKEPSRQQLEAAREERAVKMRQKVSDLQEKARAKQHVPTAKSRQEAAEWTRDRCARYSAQQGKSTEEGARIAAEAMRKQDQKRAES